MALARVVKESTEAHRADLRQSESTEPYIESEPDLIVAQDGNDAVPGRRQLREVKTRELSR